MSGGDAAAGASMDRIYRYQRHIYDITRKYYLLGRDKLLGDLQPPAGAAILEIGCGTGRNLIQAARLYPEARCFGFDISQAMLDTAQTSVKRAGLESRIALARGDATAFDGAALFGQGGFDRVFISYALSMIPPWTHALSPAIESLAPGGKLFIVDFGQQEKWPGAFRAALFAWLRKFDVFPRAGLEAELRRAADGREVSFEKLYGGYAYYATVSRAQVALTH